MNAMSSRASHSYLLNKEYACVTSQNIKWVALPMQFFIGVVQIKVISVQYVRSSWLLASYAMWEMHVSAQLQWKWHIIHGSCYTYIYIYYIGITLNLDIFLCGMCAIVLYIWCIQPYRSAPLWSFWLWRSKACHWYSVQAEGTAWGTGCKRCKRAL